MRDVVDELAGWSAAGRAFAVATVVRTWRSAPRQAGAAMAVADDGSVAGSISGGCVEGAVHGVAEEVLRTGEARLVTYGVSDDDAFAVGLTCGGAIEVLVAPADPVRFPELPDVLARLAANEPVAVATLSSGPGTGRRMVVTPESTAGSLGDPRLDQGVVEQARGLLAAGTTATVNIGAHGERRMDDQAVFVQSFAPPPRMIVFGATDFAGAVARMGKFLGYHVTVCDARSLFATRARFPDVDEVVVEWPHRYLERQHVGEDCVICVLTHEPRFDVPLLQEALRTKARYVGAMGSRRTHDHRAAQLRSAGVTEDELARLSSPIGLDLGARTPEETAVAIAAEIVSLAWGGSGGRLTGGRRPIHP